MHFFILLMGLGETIYCSLGKGYLYVGVSLHSLCGFYLLCVCVCVCVCVCELYLIGMLISFLSVFWLLSS